MRLISWKICHSKVIHRLFVTFLWLMYELVRCMNNWTFQTKRGLWINIHNGFFYYCIIVNSILGTKNVDQMIIIRPKPKKKTIWGKNVRFVESDQKTKTTSKRCERKKIICNGQRLFEIISTLTSRAYRINSNEENRTASRKKNCVNCYSERNSN